MQRQVLQQHPAAAKLRPAVPQAGFQLHHLSLLCSLKHYTPPWARLEAQITATSLEAKSGRLEARLPCIMASEDAEMVLEAPEPQAALSELFLAAERQVQRKRWVCRGSAPLPRPALIYSPTRRSENIFEQLSERSLTAEEEDIIKQRVRKQHWHCALRPAVAPPAARIRVLRPPPAPNCSGLLMGMPATSSRPPPRLKTSERCCRSTSGASARDRWGTQRGCSRAIRNAWMESIERTAADCTKLIRELQGSSGAARARAVRLHDAAHSLTLT